VSKWRCKKDVHHHLTEHILARHLSVLNPNGVQERVFSIYKHIGSTLWQDVGNAKFEMLLILAFNKAFIKDMESKDLFTVDSVVEVSGGHNWDNYEHH